MLTVITEVFGVHGETGAMIIHPKLLKEQFDSEGNAGLRLWFAGKNFHIVYKNPERLTYGDYCIKRVVCDGQVEPGSCGDKICFGRERIDTFSDAPHEIEVELGYV